MGQQLVSDCFPSQGGKRPPRSSGGSSGSSPRPVPGLGPLSTGRRTRRRLAGSSPRSGSCTSCTTSGVSGLPTTPLAPSGCPCRWWVGMWGESWVTAPSPRAAYKDLQSREETRNAAWRKRGWDENVYYTGERGPPWPCWGPPVLPGDTVAVLGAPCLCPGPAVPAGDRLPSPLSLVPFSSPADPDHGVTDNDSPEDLTPAVRGGPHRSVCLQPGWGGGSLPACTPAPLRKSWGSPPSPPPCVDVLRGG